MKDIIDMAAQRGRFIDQSQSLTLFVADPTTDKLTAMHFYAWEKGLKVNISYNEKNHGIIAHIYFTIYAQTGMYYLRTRPAVSAIQYTVDQGEYESFESSIAFQDDSAICLNCSA